MSGSTALTVLLKMIERGNAGWLQKKECVSKKLTLHPGQEQLSISTVWCWELHKNAGVQLDVRALPLIVMQIHTAILLQQTDRDHHKSSNPVAQAVAANDLCALKSVPQVDKIFGPRKSIVTAK